MEEKEILGMIRTRARDFDEARIYFVLRKMKVRYVTETQINAIQVFLALRALGQSFVTTTLFAAIMDMAPGNALTLLHRLGDKHVLNLMRELTSSSQPYRFSLSELFMNNFRTEHVS